ncbi:hypothetical protein EDB92DRAFT_150511 [Lactarius akahatsu]|uniref:Uncharacterized protein n=1 Tax=Lactarius akahatsu TaxID=416441 RepID=A0AAD4QFS9_9AGAM|nr:hypothetical protein EDB92DRAFT_150511 [Lactarius akahatsu]
MSIILMIIVRATFVGLFLSLHDTRLLTIPFRYRLERSFLTPRTSCKIFLANRSCNRLTRFATTRLWSGLCGLKRSELQ